MFDCKQDIGLLHGSLLSAANPNSYNLFDCTNLKDAIHTVYESIKMIIHHSLKEAKNEKEKINTQLYCNQRLHAALFFTTLRSHGIKSKAGDEFYEAILYNWPTMNLKFYVELNFKCDWSEYFIMSALQLPSETLFNVLKMILEIPFESDVEYYSWHLILQTLIFKLLQVPYDKKVHYPFDFDFTVESAISVEEKSFNELPEKMHETTKACDYIEKSENNKIISKCDDDFSDKSNNVSQTFEKENDDCPPISNKIIELDDEDTEDENEYLTPFSYAVSDNEDETVKAEKEDLAVFKEMFSNMYDKIALKLEKSNDMDALKILLHALKTLSKFFVTDLKNDSAIILPLEKCIRLLKDYLSTDANEEKLKNELKDCSPPFAKHAVATTSWNICLNYLVLIIVHNIDKVFSSASSSVSDLLYINTIFVGSTLRQMNCPSVESEEYIKLLCKIIEFEFESSSYAAKVLLTDPTILNRNDVLTILEENYHVIDLSLSHSIIVDHIMSANSPELKQSLLKILYMGLQGNTLDVYNTVMGYIIAKYGLTEEFQLPDFDVQLSVFKYKTPTQEEIEKKIPILLIQNPKHTLKYLIDEALVQGPEGKNFIEILKHFKNACFYTGTEGPVCILHEILNDYFMKPKLKALELKNMVMLYRFLVQVHSEAPILLPFDFFSECIIPKLHPEYDKIGLVLECTNVLLPTLLSDNLFLKDSVLFCYLIVKFGILANIFIEKGNGMMKSLIIPMLKDLEIHQQKNMQINEKQKLILWSTFKDLNEVTCVYFEAFLPEEIEFVSRAAVWIQCCKYEDASNFETKFSVESLSYTSLVNTLIEVLPHLTKNEWFYGLNLIKLCCTNHKLRDEIICANNPFQLHGSELDSYAAASTVITCLHILLNDNTDEFSYMSICSSNILKDIVFQEESAHPYLLLSVALNICHLISSISPDFFNIYYSSLLDMKKEIGSFESDESDYSKLLNHAISCLPNLYENNE